MPRATALPHGLTATHPGELWTRMDAIRDERSVTDQLFAVCFFVFLAVTVPHT